MNKITTKNIHTYISITIFSTVAILIIGAFVLFGFIVYGGINLWIATSVYLFTAIIPLIIFSLYCLKSLNVDSINDSTTRIVIVHNKDMSTHKTKRTKHLIIGV